MNALRRLLQWFKWIVRAAVFLVLLAFALNNQQEATLHLMFGHEWRAPMTLIVLAAFALGLVVGVLGMLPSWLRRRAKPAAPAQPAVPAQTAGSGTPPL
ncbi:MAG: lipopolysaccharide assembly protein LapA domain-containing protein [Burkholderiaceae bacterium]|jgi:uncharacterized integral membrane protein|nr:lipopolysaccharide assembly protein LapA domain-containing protein [Burkholderiaceae bacterium]